MCLAPVPFLPGFYAEGLVSDGLETAGHFWIGIVVALAGALVFFAYVRAGWYLFGGAGGQTTPPATVRYATALLAASTVAVGLTAPFWVSLVGSALGASPRLPFVLRPTVPMVAGLLFLLVSWAAWTGRQRVSRLLGDRLVGYLVTAGREELWIDQGFVALSRGFEALCRSASALSTGQLKDYALYLAAFWVVGQIFLASGLI